MSSWTEADPFSLAMNGNNNYLAASQIASLSFQSTGKCCFSYVPWDGVQCVQGLKFDTWGLQRHLASAFCRCVPLCCPAPALPGLKTLGRLQRCSRLAVECLGGCLLHQHSQPFGATSTRRLQPQRSAEQAAGAAFGTAPRRLQVVQQTAGSSAWQHTHNLKGPGSCWISSAQK